MTDVFRSEKYIVQNTGWSSGVSWFNTPVEAKTLEEATAGMLTAIERHAQPECKFRIVKITNEWGPKYKMTREDYSEPHWYGDGK